jgi:hypothetical protein
LNILQTNNRSPPAQYANDHTTRMTTEHLAEVGIAALLAILVAELVAHGALRTFLEARGVKPWRWSDTMLATPLIMAGAGAVGGGGAAIGHRVGNRAFITHLPLSSLWIDFAGLAAVCIGLFMLTLGVIALKKLT